MASNRCWKQTRAIRSKKKLKNLIILLEWGWGSRYCRFVHLTQFKYRPNGLLPFCGAWTFLKSKLQAF